MQVVFLVMAMLRAAEQEETDLVVVVAQRDPVVRALAALEVMVGRDQHHQFQALLRP
jgi:hypothetical protein